MNKKKIVQKQLKPRPYYYQSFLPFFEVEWMSDRFYKGAIFPCVHYYWINRNLSLIKELSLKEIGRVLKEQT